MTRNQSKCQAAREASLEKNQKDDGAIIQPVSDSDEDSDVPENPDTREPVEPTGETDLEPDTEEFVFSHIAPFNFDPSLFQQVKLNSQSSRDISRPNLCMMR